MSPLVVPGSTANMFAAASATTIIVWAADAFGGVKIPSEVAAAITGLLTLLAGHFTTDVPSAPVAREAMANATADAKFEAAAEKDRNA